MPSFEPLNTLLWRGFAVLVVLVIGAGAVLVAKLK